MKILHISTYQKGGAGIAATRLHRSLLAAGHDSQLLILIGNESEDVYLYKKRNYLASLFFKVTDRFEIPLTWRQRNNYKTKRNKRQIESFSFATTPYTRLHEHPLVRDADIINLHWVANFIDYTSFFHHVSKPIVWTLHDMHPFQGGFHYKDDENRHGHALHRLNEQQYMVKKQALHKKGRHSMTIVAPSKWLLNASKQSELLGRFPHKHIPYGIDIEIFKCLNKQQCKEMARVPLEKLAVLFVAENLKNHRKGFDMVLQLVKDSAIRSRCSFVAVGDVKQSDRIPEIQYAGTVKDEREMSVLYNAADIFILPSREDNLPFTMLESLCCGTPVVGFEIGGLKESINNLQNGILSPFVSVSALKGALMTCINEFDRFSSARISEAAHLRYASEIQAKAYESLYENCLCAPEGVEKHGV